MELVVPMCLFMLLVGQGADARRCDRNTDCNNIAGGTGSCQNNVCSCQRFYRVNDNGCQLNVGPPTLNAPHEMFEGGDYTIRCMSSISRANLPTSVTYKLERDSEEVASQVNNNTFWLPDVDDDDGGVYSCVHTFDTFNSPRSIETTVHVIEAGRRCTRDGDCPSRNGYRRSCEREISRCRCDDDYRRKGQQCVLDGAQSNMAASLAMVMAAAIISRLF